MSLVCKTEHYNLYGGRILLQDCCIRPRSDRALFVGCCVYCYFLDLTAFFAVNQTHSSILSNLREMDCVYMRPPERGEITRSTTSWSRSFAWMMVSSRLISG